MNWSMILWLSSPVWLLGSMDTAIANVVPSKSKNVLSALCKRRSRMKRVRGYKTELDLNNAQRTACLKLAGAARFAYNWGLRRYQQEYASGKRTPSAISLHKELNALKKTDFPWMYDVSKCAMQEALRDLEKAFKHFFGKCQLRKMGQWKGKLGYPKFKTKKKGI